MALYPTQKAGTQLKSCIFAVHIAASVVDEIGIGKKKKKTLNLIFRNQKRIVCSMEYYCSMIPAFQLTNSLLGLSICFPVPVIA
jgi:hypothetical protein